MYIEPMLLEDAKEPFEDERYIAELKLDGIRGIISVGERTRIYTRHHNEVTSRFPEIAAAVEAAIPKGTILDGELIVSDSEGKPDFEAMMRRFQRSRIPASMPGLNFVAFDILRRGGEDVRMLPLMERKAILAESLTENELIKRIRYVEHSFIPFYRMVENAGLEGIVIKRRDSKYYSKARKDVWQRVVCYQREIVYVTGFSRKKLAWAIGLERGGRIVPAGVVEYGLSETVRKKVFPILQSHIVRETKDYIYVEPSVQIVVRFRNWTSAGKMRLAVVEQIVG